MADIEQTNVESARALGVESVEDPLRRRAIAVLKKRRDFLGHLLVYLLVNAAFVGVWTVNGSHGFFWPIFLMAFWGIGVVMNAWDAYFVDDFSEESIRRQMRRLQGR